MLSNICSSKEECKGFLNLKPILTAVKRASLEVQGFPSAFAESLLAGAQSTEILCRFGDNVSEELKHDAAR